MAVTIYTDRAAFLAATPGATVTDFSVALPDQSDFQDPGYIGTGFTITSSTRLYNVGPDADSGTLFKWNSGGLLEFESGTGTISLDPTVTAFGFDFGNPAFKFGSGKITINGVSYDALAQPEFNFFGIVAGAGETPLSATTIDFNGGLGVLDNFTVQVAELTSAAPEPATWLTMLAGFGLAGSALRRRRRVHRAA